MKNFYLILIQLLLTVCAWAQAPVKSLSVEQLVGESLRDNPDLKAAQAVVGTAKGDRRAAGQWRNPEVTVQYGEKRVADRSTGELAGKGGAQMFSFSQTFEFPGKASLRKAIADHDVRLAGLALDQLRFEIAAEARLLTVRWLTFEQEARASREVADRSEALVQMLGKRMAAGVQFLLDQRIVEASLVNILARAREAEEARETARIALNILRGRRPDEALEVAMTLHPSGMNAGWEMLWRQASDANLALRSGDEAIGKARQELSRARIEAAPDFTISPFYSEERAVDRERVLGVGVSLPLPFWDSGRGRTDAARESLARAQAERVRAVRDVQQRLAGELGAWRLALGQLEKTPLEMLTRLRESADLADRQYRLGTVEVPTYIEMQDQYMEATAGLLGAIRDAQEHRLNIQLLTADPSLLPPQTAGDKP
ncbi:MAG: TolC family protein [Verrucomicrobiae bacterium]|nr:TolC family protein [Verrucomicrobiae bacterium]